MVQNKNNSPLLTEVFSERLISVFRANRVTIPASLVWAALAYMFAFTNKLINHDEAGQLFGKGATVSSGRWGLGFLDAVFPNVSMPWIYGVLTVVFITIAICLITHLFTIRSRPVQVLLSGSIMVFPSLIGIFGYMFTSCCYGLSFLLAVLSVWLVRRPCKWAWIPALGCLVASLSIYQSYVSVAACLLVLALIQELLNGNDALPVLKKGVGYVLFLVVALAGYYLATQVVLAVKDVSFSNYASGSITFSPAYLLEGVRLAYRNFAGFFYLTALPGSRSQLLPTPGSRLLHLALLAAIVLLLILWVRKEQKPRGARTALLAVLTGILPLAINCMYLITSEDSIHTLVLYSFVAVYILAAILADHWLRQAASGKPAELLRRLTLDGMALVLALIVCVHVYTANTAYLNMHLRYENAYAFYTSLTAQIRQMPEFQPGSKIAVAGGWKSPDFYSHNMEFTDYLMGVKGFLPSDYSYRHFMEYYIGFPAEFASDEETAAICQTEEFRNMSVYPYYGSIGIIDDVIVVKLSE